MAHDVLLILIAAGVGLVSKIVWDWLRLRKNGNGHTAGAQNITFWLEQFEKNRQEIRESITGAIDGLKSALVPAVNNLASAIVEQNKKLDEVIIESKAQQRADEMARRANA